MFGLFKKNKILVTHDGKFHADDILACAILQLILEKRGESYQVIRTRDPKIIASGDYVFDVGGEYDKERNRFDHHQVGGAGKYNSDIPYAAVGLVWKRYGEELCGASAIAGRIEEKLVMPIDADDNGINLCEFKSDIAPYRLQEFFYAFRPTWQEGLVEKNYNERFLQCVVFAKELFQREIIIARSFEESKALFEKDYNRAIDKRIIELSAEYTWEGLAPEYKDTLFVIYPRLGCFRVGAVSVKRFSFQNRKDLPASWAGLRGVDLQAVTGVSDAIFCHNGRFLAVAKSIEGARALAKLALQN